MRGFVKAANKTNPTRDFVVAARGRAHAYTSGSIVREYPVENRQRLNFNDQMPEHEKRWERSGKILQPTTPVLKSV